MSILPIISDSLEYLLSHYEERPTLADLSKRAGYEPTYFQKLFQSHVGVTPKQLSRYLVQTQAREFLLNGYSTLESAYQSGLSGNGRLHDLFVTIEAATPGEIGSNGLGMSIHYGWHDTLFGKALLAQTAQGLCWLGFTKDNKPLETEQQMYNHWPKAVFIQDVQGTKNTASKIHDIWSGTSRDKLKLNLFGTNFQLQVWQALLKIPAGVTLSYQALADYLDKPGAARAVGRAVGANPIAVLIPCHRVVQQSGLVGNYAWGSARKRLLLGLETLKNPGNPASSKARASAVQAREPHSGPLEQKGFGPWPYEKALGARPGHKS